MLPSLLKLPTGLVLEELRDNLVVFIYGLHAVVLHSIVGWEGAVRPKKNTELNGAGTPNCWELDEIGKNMRCSRRNVVRVITRETRVNKEMN